MIRRWFKPKPKYHAVLECAPGQSTLELRQGDQVVAYVILSEAKWSFEQGTTVLFEDAARWIDKHVVASWID